MRLGRACLSKAGRVRDRALPLFAGERSSIQEREVGKGNANGNGEGGEWRHGRREDRGSRSAVCAHSAALMSRAEVSWCVTAVQPRAPHRSAGACALKVAWCARWRGLEEDSTTIGLVYPLLYYTPPSALPLAMHPRASHSFLATLAPLPGFAAATSTDRYAPEPYPACLS